MTVGPALVSVLAGDEEIATLFAEDAELAAMLVFEAELARAQAAFGIIATEAGERIADVAASFRPDLELIRQGMARDGVPVPALVKQLRAAVGEPHGKAVHHGATSQDAVDAGLMLRTKTLLGILESRLVRLLDRCETVAQEQGKLSLMAHTRMQAALPFTVADKLATWRQPLESHRRRIGDLAERLPVQLGGPIGTGGSFGPHYERLRASLADTLGLIDANPWHSDRTPILDIAHCLALLSGTLGKLGQDLALMAQAGSVKLSDSGGSSAMAHKQNPVGAELLVALARFNAGLSGTLTQAMVHEHERSGSAWTLEWLVLPQIAQAVGAALNRAEQLVAAMEFRAS